MRNMFSNASTKTWWKSEISRGCPVPPTLSSVRLTVAANKQASTPTATSTHSKPKNDNPHKSHKLYYRKLLQTRCYAGPSSTWKALSQLPATESLLLPSPTYLNSWPGWSATLDRPERRMLAEKELTHPQVGTHNPHLMIWNGLGLDISWNRTQKQNVAPTFHVVNRLPSEQPYCCALPRKMWAKT